MRANDPPALEIERLAVRLDGRPVLEDVSLTVDRGTLVALVGPNGAGKTTLVRALLGQVAFEGSIRFRWTGDGRIGYVPQRLDLDRGMPLTVAELLGLALRRRPVWLGRPATVRRRAAAALDEVGVADLWHRPVGRLSGGQLRRVLLARALATGPEFLLLDEVDAGDDAGAREAIGAALARARSRGLAILMVSHALDEIRRTADRVVGLSGTIRFEGRPDDALSAGRLLEFLS